MPQPYKVTLEMANDFLEMKKQGFTLKEIGAKHNVAPRNVDYWLKKFREVGYNVPSPRVIIPPPTNEQKN